MLVGDAIGLRPVREDEVSYQIWRRQPSEGLREPGARGVWYHRGRHEDLAVYVAPRDRFLGSG